jgi:putative Mn2+ efflux pump MntP
MPLLGWLLGARFSAVIAPVDHWVAFGLLVLIGGKMLWEALRGDHEAKPSGRISARELLLLAVATILASPYAFIYDFVVLAIPLTFLGRTGFSNRELPVVIAAALLVGWGPADHLATGLLAGLLVGPGVVLDAEEDDVDAPRDGGDHGQHGDEATVLCAERAFDRAVDP